MTKRAVFRHQMFKFPALQARTKRCITRALAGLVAFLGSGFALALEENTADNWYQIEVILFEHINSDVHVLRYEDVSYMPPAANQFSYLMAYDTPLTPYHIAPMKPDEETELGTAKNRLENASATHVLFDAFWQQSIAEGETLPPLKLDLGFEDPGGFGITGTLTIRRSRYLHIDVDVYKTRFLSMPYSDLKQWFFESEKLAWPIDSLALPVSNRTLAIASIGTSDVPFSTIHFSQTRRIRDGEVHYLDHPALGLLVTIKQIEAPFQFGSASQSGSVQ